MMLTGTALILTAMFGTCAASHGDRGVVFARVTSKDISHSGESSHYLVWTEGEVLTMDDSVIEGQWDTSDDYGAIVVGECYRFDVYGWRVPFLSWYRNIVSAQEAPCPEVSP